MMDLLLTVVLFTLGIVLIVKGGDAFVDAAAWMAEVSGIPKLIVGATVVSFATTLPELLVSSMAAFDGKVDMAIGNAVGSVTANLALIMGIALVCLPSAIRRRDYLLKAVLMLGASLYLVLASSGGSLSFQSGIALLVIFVIAMWDNIRSALRSMREEQTAAGRGGHPRPMGHEVRRNLLKFLLGAAGIVIGAQLLVDHGGNLARLIGVPERIIGVTLIAVFGPGKWRPLHFTLYFLIGWSGLMFLPDFYRNARTLLWFILAGGLVYTLGMIPFARNRKWNHCVWHVLVLAAAAIHWLGIYGLIY